MLLRSVAAALLLLFCFGCSPKPTAPVDEERKPYFVEGKERIGTRDYKGAIAAFEKALEETPEEEIIERAIEKRLRLKGKPETREDAKKFYDYLLRQGFSYDLVSSKMREIASRNYDEEN